MKFQLPSIQKFCLLKGESKESSTSIIKLNDAKLIHKSEKKIYKIFNSALTDFSENNETEIDNVVFCNYLLNGKYFLDLLEDIKRIDPDIITFQGVFQGHELMVSIEGYESVCYFPKTRNKGYVTLWKHSNLSLLRQENIDYYLPDCEIKIDQCAGALITILSTNDSEDICIANTTINQSRDNGEYEYQVYILLNQC